MGLTPFRDQGHPCPSASEQPGMEDATRWLRSFVTEVPVAFVPAKDPLWTGR